MRAARPVTRFAGLFGEPALGVFLNQVVGALEETVGNLLMAPLADRAAHVLQFWFLGRLLLPQPGV